MRALEINSETTMFTSVVAIPGIGSLPINAFLIRGEQPLLVDAGIHPERDAFMAAVRERIDPADLRWIWITHADRDHTGSLSTLVQEAPNARFVTHMMALGISQAGSEPIPVDRSYLVRDGSTVDLGDRTLVAFRPPLYDSPATVGLFDPTQQLMLSSDCLGAALPTEQDALAEDVAAVADGDVTSGQFLWGSVDAPWVHSVDESKFGARLEAFASHKPETVLSTHLPPIRGDFERHVKTLSMLPTAEPFAAPDQAAVEAMMAELTR